MHKLNQAKLEFPIVEDNLINFDNYGEYVPLVQNGTMDIHTSILTEDSIDYHFYSIANILKDGIEQQRVHDMMINITFENPITIRLSIFDYMVNLLMWKIPVLAGDKITSNLLFFDDAITRNTIKTYIDKFLINIHRIDLDNKTINNIIDDTLYKFNVIDDFSEYFANTMCEEDMITLMQRYPEVRDIIHLDVSNIPLENVKDIGMEATNVLIKYISDINSDHCLRDAFRSRETPNPKQFREFYVNIGTIPNSQDGVFPHAINSNFAVNGVKIPIDIHNEGTKSRQAQILAKQNVGTSGSFAHRVGLNNVDTKIYPDQNYDCNTKNQVKVLIANEKHLVRLKNRYYSFIPGGKLYKISFDAIRYNKDLIGQYIYLRTPITCASHSRGEGICYKCYGDLAYTNNNINIGKIASEILTYQLTQMLLSAKHLLESKIITIDWVDEFSNYFILSLDSITFADGITTKKWKISINADEYDDNENEDDNEYVNCITSFDVIDPKGNVNNIHTLSNDPLYLSPDFNEIVKNKKEIDGKYIIDFDEIINIELFRIVILNSGLEKTLNSIKAILDKSTISKGKSIEYVLELLTNTILDSGIDIDSIHNEIILSNQIRRPSDDIPENILLKPEWEYPNEPYQIITLDRALKDNPSISISLTYGKTKKTLINPLTFKKTQPSCMDLFSMEHPQEFMNSETSKPPKPEDQYIKMVRPMILKKK